MTTDKKVPALTIPADTVQFLVADGDEKTATVLAVGTGNLTLKLRDGVQLVVSPEKKEIKQFAVGDKLSFTGNVLSAQVKLAPVKSTATRTSGGAGSMRAIPN